MPDDIEKLLDDGFSEDEKRQIREGRADEPAPEAETDQITADETDPPVDQGDEAEPEQSAEAPEKKRRGPKPGWLKDLEEERKRRKAMEAELSDLRSKWDAASQRMEGLLKAKPQAEEPEKPSIPDPNVDAFGHLASRLGVAESTLTEVVKYFDTQRQEQERQRHLASTQSRWHAELEEYKKQQPDIMDSMDYLAAARRKELGILGYSQEQIYNILAEEGMQIVSASHKEGKNPAERFYKLAEVRGYKPADRPATPEKAKLSSQDIQRISDGQKKVATSVHGGEVDTKELTLEQLLDMSQEQYASLVDQFKGFDRLRTKLGIQTQ